MSQNFNIHPGVDLMKKYCCLAAMNLSILLSTGAHAQSFWDGFDNDYFNTSLWRASSGKNGEPFGCTFSPAMVMPGTGGHLNLTLNNGACSQIETYSQYKYGTLQTQLQYSNVPGTVASLFTYDSYYIESSHPWQEVDIEFLPSFPDLLHTNLIYQSGPSGTYQQWEKYISLAPYNVNPVNGPVQVGFDWSATQISWFIFDSSGNKHYIRTITNSNAANCDCVPAYAWPNNGANIYANYWEGDNTNYNSVTYFPLKYNGASGTASYNFIQYIAP